MLAHLSQFSLLTSRQLGFLPRRSTLTSLLVAEEFLTEWLDDGSAVERIYLDFSKALASVSHRLLLGKLRGYGIALIVISWVECFLSRRTLQVNVNITLSQVDEAISDIPKGSAIGPIFFVIYAAYLLDRLLADSLLYANGYRCQCVD